MTHRLNPTEALRRAIELAGGQSALARKLSQLTGDRITQVHVWNWLNRSGRITDKYTIAAERAVDSEVTRRDLRPDLYPANERAIS